MPPLLEKTMTCLETAIFILFFSPLYHDLSFFTFQALAMMCFVSGPSIFLGQAQQSVPVLFQLLSFGVAAADQLPSLFSDGFKLLFLGPHDSLCCPRIILPAFFLLEPFLFPDNFCFVTDLFKTLGGWRPSQSWSPCPLYVDTLILPLVSSKLPLVRLHVLLFCLAAFLFLMCGLASWIAFVMSFHLSRFLLSLVHCSWEP